MTGVAGLFLHGATVLLVRLAILHVQFTFYSIYICCFITASKLLGQIKLGTSHIFLSYCSKNQSNFLYCKLHLHQYDTINFNGYIVIFLVPIVQEN